MYYKTTTTTSSIIIIVYLYVQIQAWAGFITKKNWACLLEKKWDRFLAIILPFQKKKVPTNKFALKIAIGLT